MLIEATDHDFQRLLSAKAPSGLRLPAENIEDQATLEMLRQVALSVRPSLGAVAWMMIEGEEVMGLLSIIRIVNNCAVLIGYGVAAPYRGRGICTRALSAFLDLMAQHPSITEVLAETSVENRASQRVLENNGFERVGQRTDEEDGELFCWRVVLAKSGKL